MPDPIYPFDSTGLLPSNKIINESVTVSATNAINAYLIVPDAGPFYGSSLSIVIPSGRTLIENVDYYLTHRWAEASNNIGLDVYGTITLLDGYPVGLYYLNYQTIGGEYVTAKANAIASGIIASAGQYLDVDWSTAPTVFPPMPHTHDLTELGGMTSLFQGLHGIAEALRSPARGVHVDDVEGLDTHYAISFLKPMVETIASIVDVTNAEARLALPLVNDKMANDALALVPKGLQHYTIPLPGDFKLKIGKIVFNPGDEPARIVFAAPAFKDFCHFAFATISLKDAWVAPIADKVRCSAPNKTGFKITVDYDPANTVGVRSIQFIAIGR